MIETSILKKLNAPEREQRLRALKELKDGGAAFPAPDARYINNHIHSTFSFSPYSPTAAAYCAKANGLCTAGIMDHDSMGGAREFIEAGDIIGIPTTIGLEFRVNMAGTPLEKRRTNNPDQIGCTYMTLHAVPHGRIEDVQAHFAPLREKRNTRNRAMLANVNALLDSALALDFERDVLPLSEYANGGAVTERHLMFALTKKLIGAAGRGPGAIESLAKLGVALSEKQAGLMLDTESSHYEYDLLGILKSAFVPRIFVPATEECMTFPEAAAFCKEIGGIFCYPYLGDVGESVTGDKAAQKFEDEYLDELFEFLQESGIRALTYMPPRNTEKQLARLRSLCDKYAIFQISGEDINSPRQDFVCKAMEDPQFGNLIDAAWALIDHERGIKKIVL